MKVIPVKTQASDCSEHSFFSFFFLIMAPYVVSEKNRYSLSTAAPSTCCSDLPFVRPSELEESFLAGSVTLKRDKMICGYCLTAQCNIKKDYSEL